MAILGFGNINTTIAPEGDFIPPAVALALAVTLDAVINEDVEHSVTVTDHPIESGSSVSDHIRDNPDTITITGIVSRTPANLIDVAIATATLDFNRHETVWQKLRTWIKEHTLVTVTTPIKTWEHMAIQSLTRSRTADVGEVAQFTLKLREITKVYSAQALAPARPPDVQKPAAAGGVETAGEVAAPDKSIAFVLGGG
jgi:hypothetical protein